MIALGSDHAGFRLKKLIFDMLTAEGYDVMDVGTYTEESCDYPIYALKVANAVNSKICDRGILVCGTGLGVSMAANKVSGIRAAKCDNEFEARLSREHNDANVLCLGARVTGDELAKAIVEIFLKTEFQGGKHQRRIDLFNNI